MNALDSENISFIDHKTLLLFSRVILSFKTSYLFIFAQVYHSYRFYDDELISYSFEVTFVQTLRLKAFVNM